MSAVLTAENLSVERGGRKVLNDVSFSIEPGEVFALLGGNGAGKSTTLLTFLGFIKPSGGRALAFGQSVEQDVAAVHRRTAYLPEAANLYQHLSARENLRYFLSLAGTQCSATDIEMALDQVSLAGDARDQQLNSYSKGMRQKVAIALAILRKAPLVLLDEPTSGLDPVAIDEFNALVVELAQQGTTVLMVTHDVYGACRVADRVGLLRDGTLVGHYRAPAQGQISVDTVHQAFAEQHNS